MIKLSIVSPEKELFNGEVTQISLPGKQGRFTIFPNHAPIISSLDIGEIRYITIEGVEHSLEIEEGFVECSNNHVTLCLS